jgi:hypothetical protein
VPNLRLQRLDPFDVHFDLDGADNQRNGAGRLKENILALGKKIPALVPL